MTNGQSDGDSGALPPGFVRAVLDDASYTDSLMDALEARLVALEEVAAGRGVRRLILLWRLGRTLRASVRPYSGRSFARSAAVRRSRPSGSRRSHGGRVTAIADTAPAQDYGASRYCREHAVREGGIAVVSVADFAEPQDGSYSAELDEQARRKGVRPITSADELRADVFESDEELDEFLADLETFRHEHMA